MVLWHNIGEMMDYYLPAMPATFWIDITRLCNLRCIICPQSMGLQPREAMMPLERFRAIVDDVCENHPVIKLYLSGEPLLHDGLVEMIEYAHAKGCRTVIHTNATLLTPEMSQRILESSLDVLSFSFDGCNAEVYEKLRPPAKFEEVRSHITGHLDLRRNAGGAGPRTVIEIIHTRETDGFLESFVEEWKASGIDEVRIAEYMTWLDRVADRRVDKAYEDSGYKPCAAPFRYGCILSDGTVVPCCMDVDGRMPLGNVTEQPFHEVWVGNAYRRLRLQLLTGDLPPDLPCRTCTNIVRDTA
jgi:MoaA/NifB/PqqE/SkfB family radical SAM enzyme